jgi:DNA-binding CsgD family transcriptional regulator
MVVLVDEPSTGDLAAYRSPTRQWRRPGPPGPAPMKHGLVRSAIYQAATFTARQAAHQALITVLQGEQQAERRAWHLAAATIGPDEQVAAALEASADRARRRGGPAAAAAALERAAALTPERGPHIRRLVAAADYSWEAGHAQRAQVLLDQVEPAPADPAVRARIASVRGYMELALGTPATACTLLLEGANLKLESDAKRATDWMWPMLVVAEPAEYGLNADEVYAGLVAARRAAGTASSLTVALANLAMAETSLGRWADAIGHATEGLQLAAETGQQATAGYFLALLASLAAGQGRTDDCRRLLVKPWRSRPHAGWGWPRRSSPGRWRSSTGRGPASGRPGTAVGACGPPHPTSHAPIALLATGDLVEAAAHADRLDGMEPVVASFERWAQWDQRVWFSVVACRCRALITHGADAEGHFQAALAVDGIAGQPFELARTELVYGEWLRRGRRRAEARPRLRTALEVFERLGATPWAERARAELRVSGETARKRDPSTEQQLTPQERQVALLATQGLSNLQIADQLFVSRHTVGYHLHKVYAKLGITSRAEMAQLDLDNDDSR